VVSHTIESRNGRQTIGLIYPGTFCFNTGVQERMDIVGGECRVRLRGAAEWSAYKGGDFFEVPGNSSFEICVEKGIAEYLCSYGK
jgi:uncharacterized protein YaiE (UPF0345 family)